MFSDRDDDDDDGEIAREEEVATTSELMASARFATDCTSIRSFLRVRCSLLNSFREPGQPCKRREWRSLISSAAETEQQQLVEMSTRRTTHFIRAKDTALFRHFNTNTGQPPVQ
jgi:hypothetical protein